MNVSGLAGYLVGRKQAIQDIAAAPYAVLLGAIFVLSAGFAREYDGEDLLREPWHLALPLVASLITSFLLYCILFLAVQRHSSRPVGFRSNYRKFLSLYWMTAPLAWIYAIPVEIMTTPGEGVKLNLYFLATVSIWRVLLITRSSSVLFGASFWSMFFLVMLFADALALAIVSFAPLPIFNIMGGIRLTESEAIIRDAACEVQFFGSATLPIWFVASCVVLVFLSKRNWKSLNGERTSISRSLWILATSSVLIWSFILPQTQPPQQRRWTVENHLSHGRIADAVSEMSLHPRDAFPPHWDPPPWPAYGLDKPRLIDVVEAITKEQPVADWVKALYIQKLMQQIDARFVTYYFWDSLDENDFNRYLAVLARTPETHKFVIENRNMFVRLIESDDSPNSGTRKKQILSLFEAVGIPLEDTQRVKENEQNGTPDQ